MAFPSPPFPDDPLDFVEPSAAGVNNHNQVVGNGRPLPKPPVPGANGNLHSGGASTILNMHGYLYSGGTYYIIDDPLAAPNSTGAQGINNAGNIVGFYFDSNGREHGFLYSGGSGSYTTLDYPGVSTNTEPHGINDAGQIVGLFVDGAGSHGFLYSGGKYTTLDDPLVPPGRTEANSINNAGQIVGDYFDSNGREHGFLYSGGSYTTLDDPAAGPGGQTLAQGINNNGQIVGYFTTANGQSHGFFYSGGKYFTFDEPSAGPLGTQPFGINDAGQIVGDYFDSSGNRHDFILTPISAQVIQRDYLAITHTALSLDQATSIASAIIADTQTEQQYVNGFLAQAASTTIPALAVEGSMYGAVGSSAEITKLATQFLPGQVANAILNHFNPVVYGTEALGLVFAFGDENGGMAFATNFGPANAAMPATAAGDAAFAAAAASAIFGSAATVNTPGAIQNFVSNWEGFYTSYGIPGVGSATAVQIDLAARGAAWGDAVGIALVNNLGLLNGQAINFLEDATRAFAIYSASLASQPSPAPFQGAATGSGAGAASDVQLTGVATPSDHIWDIAPILHVMAGLM